MHEVTHTPIYRYADFEGMVDRHKIFEIDGLRAGVFEQEMELTAIVNSNLYGKMRFSEPLSGCNNTSLLIEYDLKSNVDAHLSPVQHPFTDNPISCSSLPEQSQNVDLILGEQTQTFLNQPVVAIDNIGQKVRICQVGRAGIKLGKLDLISENDVTMLSITHVAPKVSQSQ
jgi:5'-nucleotidase